ncbi:hypothetical protein N0X72_00995 [Streptomyces carpaticus]|uniref:hypothetical protein n=1 Tax=Streptomyces carpaticus TaxID=285558 RepID=UPI0021FFE96C|nr:hypothetical protein N0X72_00995 [Streptomyces carpaticus]
MRSNSEAAQQPPTQPRTVGQLIRLLEDFDERTPVLLALRPEFPFAHQAGDIVTGNSADGTLVVFIAQGPQQSPLPYPVRNQLDWPPQ